MFKKIVLLIVVAAIATTTLLQGADASSSRKLGIDEFDSSQVQLISRNLLMERIERQARTPRVGFETKKQITNNAGEDENTTFTSGNSFFRDVLDVVGNSAFYIARNRLLVMMTEVAINNMTSNAPNAALLAHGFVLMSDVIYNQGIKGNLGQTIIDLYHQRNLTASTVNIMKNVGITCLKAFTAWQLYEMDTTAVYQIAGSIREANRAFDGRWGFLGGEFARHNIVLGKKLWESSKDYIYKGAITVLTGACGTIAEIYAKPKEHWSMATHAFKNAAERVKSTASSVAHGIKSWIFG
ncbi:MAG: hypothetical protein ACTHJ4_00550 [Candidatus Nucleicultricaceae bacterium]